MIERDPYITIEEAMELLGQSRALVFDKISRGDYIVKRADESSKNGKTATLVQVLSLPTDAQVKYWEKTLASPLIEGPVVNLAEFPESSRAKASKRLPIVFEAIEIKRERVDVTNRLRALAQRAGEHMRTIERWVSAYREHGTLGLIPQWGKTNGRFISITPELSDFIHERYLRDTLPTPTTVFDELEHFCADYPEVGACPSEATVAKFIRDKVRYSAAVMARQGMKAWNALCAPKTHRDPTKHAVGEIWVGDHRQMDVIVKIILITKAGTEIQLKRPWLTAWYDVRSRKCVGYHVSLNPNSRTIALALRNAFLSHGVPKGDNIPGLLYVDNGKDYKSYDLNGDPCKSHGKIDLPEEVKLALAKGLLHPLGIEIQHAGPYMAWHKPIEQWFKHTFPEWEKTLPGWTGRDAKHRPEKLAGEITRGDLLTLDEFKGRLAACIDEFHRTPHYGFGMEGMMPMALWQDVKIERPDPRQLDIMLMPRKVLSVSHMGIKAFGTKTRPHYYHHDLLRLEHVGHKVEVRWDPEDLSAIVVFKGNEFLCVATDTAGASFRRTEEERKAAGRLIIKARTEQRNYIQNNRLLTDPDEAHRQVVNQRPQVTSLRGRAATPAPAEGTIVRRPRVADIQRGGFDKAADALDIARAQINAMPPALPFLQDNDEIPAALLVDRRPKAVHDDEDAFMETLLRKKG